MLGHSSGRVSTARLSARRNEKRAALGVEMVDDVMSITPIELESGSDARGKTLHGGIGAGRWGTTAYRRATVAKV